MNKHSKKIANRYNRVSAVYDLFETPMEMMAMKIWRQEIINELQGKVLEVGVGTGKNLEIYPENLDITGIDFSDKMLEKAKKKLMKLNKNVTLSLMDAQAMDFNDNTFDTIFTTCVFCSVPDPVMGLKEIRRVCKPDGKIILLEHVRSEKKVLGLLMDLLNPAVVQLYGANINRKTVENTQLAGFTNIRVTDLWGDIVKKIVITNVK